MKKSRKKQKYPETDFDPRSVRARFKGPWRQNMNMYFKKLILQKKSRREIGKTFVRNRRGWP